MKIPDNIKDKLQRLPDKPGVYFMRDARGKIIYVGKAASLRDRVRSYFHRATLRSAPPKLRGLVRSIADLDILVARTEAEATLTEGRMIKDYRPRYNVQFKDDKRFLLLRIDLNEPFPRLDAVRLDKGDGATYFGPYASSQAARAALEFVDKRFGLRRCRPAVPGPEDHRHCLNDIVRYCSAPCIAKISREQYLERVERACAFLRGESPEILRELEQSMGKEAGERNFEKAAALRDTLLLLRRVVRERARVRKTPAIKAEDARAGVAALRAALGLERDPRTIEACDISNISGTHAVGSLVCAVDGMPQKSRYRMFRIRTVAGADDPRMMAEVIRRRFERAVAEGSTLPDLLLVDGGITQLRAARAELDRLGLSTIPAAGLAKRFEEVYWEPPGRTAKSVRLPPGSPALAMLQRLRDEAHRFALTYHLALRHRRIRESLLDDIEGIGERRKELLLRHFGSMARLAKAPEREIAEVPGVGPAVARRIRDHLGRA
jgi:excinuclease ABC subunit C